jgi:membrane associated rhomboid family serine protease
VIPIKDDNPTRRKPVLTIGLIVVCALVFLFQWQKPADASLDGQLAFSCEYGLVADHLVHGEDPREGGRDDPFAVTCQGLNQEHNRFLGVLTSMFLHGGWLHLGGNMLFLWVFGNNIEDRLGRLRFLPFYLLVGVAAGLAQVIADPGSDIPLIGASGAISGVLGAYILLFPRAPVWTIVPPFFFLPFKIPAFVWLALYFVLQFVYLGGDATAGGGGVAYWAHIGGFIAGIALIKPFLLGRREPPPPALAHRAVY